MEVWVVKACCDLGVVKKGADLAPLALEEIDSLVEHTLVIKKEETEKETEKENKKKNIGPLNHFNRELYEAILGISKDFVVTIGGDHSISIASSLASKKKHGNIGLLWIDSHADFHDFSTTISGNIHGMPFATICGQNGTELSYFFDGKYYNPRKCVLIGGRDIEEGEYKKLKEAGVHLYSTSDIKEQGIDHIIKEALSIVNNHTNGLHVSFDLDVIDPREAPGVSVPAKDGISSDTALQIVSSLLEENIVSFDLVEYNPLYDKEDKTKKIALEILTKLIEKEKEKSKTS